MPSPPLAADHNEDSRIPPPAQATGMFTRIVLLAIILALGACNTMQGMGRDIQAAGEALQDAAE